MSSYSESKFPVELYDRFIDELSDETESTRTALRACLFVSKSFRQRARRHLFSKVQIEDAGKAHRSGGLERMRTHEEMPNRLKLLIDLMRPPVPATIGSDQAPSYAHSQGILPYIRHVHFGFGDEGVYNIIKPGVPASPESANYAIDILGMLGDPTCTLEGLEIDGFNEADHANWNELLPHVRSSLLQLCRGVSSKIALKRVNGVPSSILRGTRINHVTFEEVALFKPRLNFNLEVFPEYDNSITSLPLPNLQSAWTDSFDDFRNKIYPLDGNNPHLHMKTLELSHYEFEEVIDSFDRMSEEYPNLETLMIQILPGQNDLTQGTQFDNQKMVSLKKLAIEIGCLDFALAVPYMTTILKFGSYPALSTIRLSVTELISHTADGSFDADLNLFRDLDTFLCDPFNFALLQSVILHLRLAVRFSPGVERSQESDEGKFRMFFEKAFPCLDLVKPKVELILEFDIIYSPPPDPRLLVY